ncbi:MAG: ABC transporter ATP-binding protein [Deltaproteobacteria bacterium]|nr:ABC transporter ATP-binding protein [Deltaproteobacteria bacterium]
MRRLLGYVRPYLGLSAVAGGLLLLGSGLNILQPYLVKVAIDRFIVPGTAAGLGTLAWLYVGLLLAEFAVRYAQSCLLNLTGQRIMRDLRMAMFRHMQRLPLAYFDRNPVGRLMTRLTSDVENLNEMFTSGLVAIFGDVVRAAGIVAAMLLLDLRLTLVTFAVLPLLAVATRAFQVKARHSYRLVRLKLARLNAFLQESIAGMRVIQLFAREPARYRQFDRINTEHRDATLQSILYYAVFYPTVELLSALAIALVIWYGGGGIAAGALSFGALVAFIEYVQRFFQPVKDLSEKYNIMQSAMASSERIFELLDTPAERYEGPAAPARLRGRIEFRHVWFAYTPGHYALRDISFTVREGERVALVGATGAGKTSIMNLLSRFYPPERGEILIDGVDLREFSLTALRRRVGLVLQDPFIFAGTVRENILLGEDGRDAARGLEIAGDGEATGGSGDGEEAGDGEMLLLRAARLAQAHEFVARLPRGYQEELKERGAILSVGQRQLIAVARAIAADPDILVLDEATSSIDPETEAKLQAAIRGLLEGRTAIVIAHRLSTIRHVDRIIVLHKGEVREEGTHDELLARGGIYARLHALQFGP